MNHRQDPLRWQYRANQPLGAGKLHVLPGVGFKMTVSPPAMSKSKKVFS